MSSARNRIPAPTTGTVTGRNTADSDWNEPLEVFTTDNEDYVSQQLIRDRGELLDFLTTWRSNNMPFLVDDYPNGWPRLAAFQNSANNFLIFRRFGLMHCRQLLRLQGEITLLEKRLLELDREGAADGSKTASGLTSLEYQSDWDWELRQLHEKLAAKLQLYGKYFSYKISLSCVSALTEDTDDLLLKDVQLRDLQRAPQQHHRSLFNWLHMTKPLRQGQCDWIFHADDFVSIKKSSGWQLPGVRFKLLSLNLKMMQKMRV